MRRLLLTLVACFALIASAWSQSYILNEGFEGATFPPSGWTTVDNDGDGHGWLQGGSRLTVYQGQSLALSYTSDPEAYPIVDYDRQDNYLITPQLNITNNAHVLQFYYAEEDIESEDSLVVLVSTKTNAVADFTDKIAELKASGNEETVEFERIQRSLSKYAGQKIYIAFVHRGTGGYAIALDAVSVQNQKGPQRVSGLKATPASDGTSNVNLTWTNPTTDGQGTAIGDYSVKVYRDGTLIATLPKGTTSYTDTGASQGDHTYAVSVSNAEGESLQRTVTVHAGEDIPGAVTNVDAEVSNGKVTLTWNAPAKGANNGYIDAANLKYNILKTVNGTRSVVQTGYRQTTLTEDIADGALTFYEVAAVNAAGTGDTVRSNSVVTYSSSNDEITVGANATSEYANSRLPIDAYSRASVSETIYFPEELHNVKGSISHIIYRNAFGPNTTMTRKVQVYLGETTQTSLASGWIETSQLTKVFDGDVTMRTGENDIPIEFSTPYSYQGGNLVVLVHANYGTSGTYVDHFFVAKTADKADRSRLDGDYSEYDITKLPATARTYAEVPYTRFVMHAEGVGTFSGSVKDSEGNAVSGAVVSIPSYNLTDTTGTDGKFTINYIPVGSQNVNVTATGYEDYATTIDITEAGLAQDITLNKLAQITYSGKVVASDSRQPLSGARISTSGYDTIETTTDASGNFTLTGIYAGKDYSVQIAKSNYDIFNDEINSTANVAKGTVTLERSLIPAYGVDAAIASDGSNATVTWKSPFSRNGRIGFATIGNSDKQTDTNGDSYYSPTDYSAAIYWSAQVAKDSSLVGQSILGMRVYLKATAGTFTAHVWKGDRSIHTSVAEKAIPLEDISADGSWVDVTFDEPVEIKDGENFMVGVNVKNGSEDPIGTYGEYGRYTRGQNNVKFTDADGAYTYDGYYAWNILAKVGIPGTELPVDEASAAPLPTYEVSRSNGNGQWTKVATTSELSYTDNQWTTLPSGSYIYNVKAVYANGTSAAAYSDSISRSIDYDAGVAAFTSPQKSVQKQTSVDVSGYVKNYGEKPLTSIPVALVVNGEQKGTTTLNASLAKGDSTLVTFNSVALEDNKINKISLVTLLSGDEASANDTLTISISNLQNVVLHGFRWDIFESRVGPITINTNNPEATTLDRSVTPEGAILASGSYADGKVYGYTTSWQSVPQKFVGLDPSTWTPETSASTEDFVLDMSYNKQEKKMYGIAAKLENGKTLLVTVNLDNGALTIADTLQRSYHAFAIDKSGQMYGIDRDGYLCRFYHRGTVTAEIPVGFTGVGDVSYFQSMTFDDASGRLFWVHSGSDSMGELYEVSTTDGSATDLGTVLIDNEPVEAVALYTTDSTTDGINGIKASEADSDSTAPRYNLSGQRVGNGYRGVVIRNGKKIIIR